MKYRKNTESKNPKVVRTKTGRILLLSKCAVCNCKKLQLIKEQEGRELFSKSGMKVPILSDISILNTLFWKYKKNAIVNKVLLPGDTFMPEIHLKQPRFTYTACGSLTKNKERIKRLKKQEIQNK